MVAYYEERILARIDEQVETATDDQLFATGYLRGHITLAAIAAEEAGEILLDDLSNRVQQSLFNAIKAGELSPDDQKLVYCIWEQLYQQEKGNYIG